MRIPKTYISLLVDTSGSMNKIKPALRQGYEHLAARLQARSGDDLTFDVWGFSSTITGALDRKALPDMPVGGGQTALCATLRLAIEHRIRSGLELEAGVAVVLLSDGGNNYGDYGYYSCGVGEKRTWGGTDYALDRIREGLSVRPLSNRTPPPDIAELVDRMRSSGQWTFTWARANTVDTCARYGFQEDEIIPWDHSPDGIIRIMNKIEAGLGRYLDARHTGEMPEHLL